MTRLHHHALVATKHILAGREWERVSSPYVGDLRISAAELLDSSALMQAYEQAVRPQLDIAQRIGFRANWHWVG